MVSVHPPQSEQSDLDHTKQWQEPVLRIYRLLINHNDGRILEGGAGIVHELAGGAGACNHDTAVLRDIRVLDACDRLHVHILRKNDRSLIDGRMPLDPDAVLALVKRCHDLIFQCAVDHRTVRPVCNIHIDSLRFQQRWTIVDDEV